MKRSLPNNLILRRSIGLTMLFLLTWTISGAQTMTVDYGKSYINVTKGLNGGTVEPGDTLEFRSTLVVRCAGTCPSYVDSCAYYDTLKTGMAYIPGSLAVLTNEGKVYKAFTDAAGDDCGQMTLGNIRIHLGFNPTAAPATAFRRGRIANNHKPSYFGGSVILVASYRVRVTSALGTLINTGGGAITYKPIPAATPLRVSFPQNNVRVFTNFGICTNTVGVNALGTETNGTFGSGRPRNRGTSGSVPATYIYAPFTTGSPQDYYYGIANNTSTQNYSTSNAWAKPDPSSPTHRVFQVWDIIGDHTGAVSPILGNPAADTVANPNGGYMLVVNASYRIDSAFSHTISGLCPNTYYELSAWFRNICSKCGCDSNGKGASNTSGPIFYIPTAPGDSSGVYPNLTIKVDGVDYYTSGNMRYTGQWIKKGFTYVTGPTQTSLTMTIRNNAPGGGGNDWAIDDISLATCTPNLNLTPSGGVNVCYGNQVDMNTIVRCFTPNYVYWTWERSNNGGATWTPTGVSGIGTPSFIAGNWQYTANYPSFLADSSVHNNMFRIRVASTAANLLNPNCSFTASNTIVVWVNNCSEVLKTKLIAFNGKLSNNHGELIWITDNEQSGVQYEVQRSDDNFSYTTIGTINGSAPEGQGKAYNFLDNNPAGPATYYRIRMLEGTGQLLSKVVLLGVKPGEFSIKSVINPFTSFLSFDVVSPNSGTMQVMLIDSYGRIVRSTKQSVAEGLNSLSVEGLNMLSTGAYTLRIQFEDKILNKRVVKMNF